MAELPFRPGEFAALAEVLFAAGSVEHTAEHVVTYLRDALEVEWAGITLIRAESVLVTVAPTAPVVAELDNLQYGLGEGPCHEAAWVQRTLVSRDLASDPRWPLWGPEAAELGVRSVLAVELSAAGERVGAVNLYSDRPRDYSAADIEFAHVSARHSGLALSAAVTSEALAVTSTSREQIGRAVGILMERYGIDSTRSLTVLNQYALDHDVEVAEIAGHLNGSGSLLA